MPPIYNTQRIKRPILFLRKAGLASFLAGAVAISAHAQQDHRSSKINKNSSNSPTDPARRRCRECAAGVMARK